ncbi:MAG: type II toxin-antitoxin system RelE/ParE family toxin [Candidatus Aenigmarchaeota archaeon]|nr:type II toxin-antitoxin system RelE/ParE family toxin [Candidatus Aenigmarchaeota archaeon]
MVEIRYVVPAERFERELRKIKDKGLKEKLKKQITKITENPGPGKPPRYDLKGEWTTCVRPYRLIYKVEGDKLILLKFEHMKEVYG